MSSSSHQDCRKFNTYKSDELTIEQARQHRDALLQQMDKIVSFAQHYPNDPDMFPTLKAKFLRCQKEEQLYRTYTYQLFLSQPPHTYTNNTTNSLINHNNSSNNSNYHKTNNNNENLPDIPDDHNHNHDHDDHKNNSIIDYHSAEEKKCELIPDIDPITKITTKQHRLSPPHKHKHKNKNKSRPYIDDNNTHNTQTVPHTITITPPNDEYTNIAYLLFTEWPHPINLNDLYPKYYNHFRKPLELNNDDILTSNPKKWICKRTNPYYALYGLDHNHNEKWDEKYYFWEIVDILAFFNSYDSKHQEALIREKIQKTFNGLHPEGLKSDQIDKLFRYCIGLQIKELSPGVYNAIRQYVFKQYRNEQDGEVYIMMHGSSSGGGGGKGVLRESWKVYSLSVKHQMICILTESVDKMSMNELKVEYKGKFGVELDMKSWWVQSNLDKLIDAELYKREMMLKISDEGKVKHKAWIEWWDCNGPNKCNNNEKLMNNNDNKQSSCPKRVVYNAETHNNDVRKYEDKNSYNYPKNNNGYNYDASYEESENQYGHNNNFRRGGHDPDTLLFISGFTENMSQNVGQILKEIEVEYKIKFANHRAPVIRWGAHLGYLAPIPVENIDMATRLISRHELRTQSMQNRCLKVRKYETNGKSRYDRNNRFLDNQRSNNNIFGGGYDRNNGGNNYQQSGRNNDHGSGGFRYDKNRNFNSNSNRNYQSRRKDNDWQGNY